MSVCLKDHIQKVSECSMNLANFMLAFWIIGKENPHNQSLHNRYVLKLFDLRTYRYRLYKMMWSLS